MLRQHFGHWFTLRAHAERDPFRVSVAFNLGDLPQAWGRTRHQVTRTWTAVVGLALILPFAIFLMAALFNAVGVGGPMRLIGSSSAAIVGVSVSVFIGIPIAFVLNLWRITHGGLRRRQGELEGLLAFEFAPLHLLVIAIALVIGGLFVGHLAADSYACMKGIRSAC